MGKKLSHKSSGKIEKKQPPQQQEGINTLIKVLKPRVYITDSSTFKSLVQELTGNGNITSGIPSFPPPLPVIDLDDGGYQESSADLSSFDSSQVNNFIPPTTTTTTTFDYSQFQESTSPEFSFDSSQVNSSINIPTSFGDYPPVQIGNNGFSFEYSSSEVNVPTPFANFEYSRPLESCLVNDMSNMETGFSQYKEIESWLLEVDPTVYSNDDCYVTSNIEQEVSVSDYDLSGSHMIIF